MAGKGPSLPQRKDKRAKEKEKADHSLPVQLTINNYIYQPEHIQVGDHNKQVIYPVDEAQRLLKQGAGLSSTLSRNDVLVGMINSIINPFCVPNPDALSLHDINKKFKEIYHEEFEKVAGEKLKCFLEKNYIKYDLFEDDRLRTMVRPMIIIQSKKQRKKGKKSEYDTLERKQNESCPDGKGNRNPDTFSEAETEYMTAGSDYDLDESYDSSFSIPKQTSSFLRNWRKEQELNSSESTDSDDETHATLRESSVLSREWQKVVRRGRRKLSLEYHQSDSETYERSIDKKEREDILTSLLMKSESTDLIFRRSVAESLKHPCSLMLDIVSMWNTTSRTRSFIVFGVQSRKGQPHILLGIQNRVKKDTFNTLFECDYFTSTPRFQYFETKYKGQIFGLLEIPSSYGAGQPVVTKKVVTHNNQVCFSSNQLWIRSSEFTEPLELSDPTVGMVYQWFAGSYDNRGACGKDVGQKKTRIENLFSAKETTTEEESFGEDSFDTLAKFRNAVREFRKGQYILIAGDLNKDIKNLEVISMVPWIYVFDFDYLSRDSGILCANEDFLKRRRSLHISTWTQPPNGISEMGTSWTFLRGIRDHPESVFILKDQNAIRQWFPKVKSNIDLHIDQIQRYIEDYTVITIVVLWPFREELAPFMNKLVLRMDDGIDPKAHIVLCMPSKPSTALGESVLRLLENEMGDSLTIIEFDLDKIFESIGQIMKGQQNTVKIKYELPTGDHIDNPAISESEAAWLREELDVLYLSNPYTKSQQDIHALEEEGEQFFRGGTLHWFAWYEVGAGHFDAERDLMEDVVKSINDHINENRSGIVTLYHSPGAGGSTLAQRVLWEFHTKTPCAQVKIRSALSTSALVSRIEMLFEKTHKPVLLLLDGDDEVKGKHLIRTLKSRCYVIILYVKRYTYKESCRGKLFLGGTISKSEAKRVALKFKYQCREDTSKQEQLDILCCDIERGIPHLMYEFGLAAYLHEYKGIEKYVKGYIWPSKKEMSDNLELGRRILCYLSLAYYYGQTALPIQFFGAILHKAPNYIVEMNDMPYPVAEFVVKEKNESKTNNIRICHYLVAKEIIEQVVGNSPEIVERVSQLCLPAKQKLGEVCKEFIDYASMKKSKSGHILYVLTRIFIFRDNKDMGENVEQGRKKPLLSRVMTDIYSKGPLFTERLEVLKKLTEAFPDDQNFHAHLGRFYVFCRPNEHDKAEECLQRATEICDKQIAGRKIDELDDRLLQSLMHVYHMYGTLLQKRIARFTGQYLLDDPDIETTPESFVDRLTHLIPLAKSSCLYFTKCRQYTPTGQESCLGFVGEITVRLQICDFIERNFDKTLTLSGIEAFLSSKISYLEKEHRFVKKSISKIDTLLMECFYTIEEEDIDYHVQNLVFWYNKLFHKHAVNLEEIAAGDDIHSFRLQIVAKKLKYGGIEKNFALLEKVDSEDDITKIVELYENIFRESSCIDNKSALDRDYTEWIFAIRHKCFKTKYTIENVLQHVRRWHESLHSPMSKFYLFILTSLLGFGRNNTNGSSEFLLEAGNIRKDLEKVSKFVLKPRYPREWLGRRGEGIRILEPGARFLGYAVVDDRTLREDLYHTLRVCKGTICAPNNKRFSGYISLDLGNNLVPVRVFYIPYKARLASIAYAEKRVEFILGFSLNNGYEAFNVHLLTKYECSTPGCRSRIEMTSDFLSAKCPGCKKTIHKHELNEVV